MRAKLLLTFAAVIIAVLATFAGIQALSHRKGTSDSALAAPPLAARATQADRQIQIAEARIKQLPSLAEGYNLLAAAYMQKARETGDFGFSARAETALDRSLELSPDDRLTLNMHATLLLTYHRFRQALEEAKRMQASGPESAELYGVMTDALVELGDYEEAIKSAQKMMNL